MKMSQLCSYCIMMLLHTENSDDADGDKLEVEFLVHGDLLRSSLESHLARKTVSSVSLLCLSHCLAYIFVGYL